MTTTPLKSMPIDTALHVFLNRELYKDGQVIIAAMTIAAEMRSKPRWLKLLGKQEVSYSNMPLKQLADELGLIKAQIANLETDEKEIKNLIHESGEKNIDGEVFSVTVGEDYTNTTISLVNLAKKAPKIFKLLEPFINHTTCIGRILVRARG